MTVSSNTIKAGPFACDGVVDEFEFAFKTFAASQVRVVRTDTADVETDLVLDSSFTVLLNADQDNNPGGVVTTGTVYADGKITVISASDFRQETDLTNAGGFYPQTIETMVDKNTVAMQELSEAVARSVKTPVSSTEDPDDLVNTIINAAASASSDATAAAASAAAALTSENNAATSATTASTQATNAAASATAAAGSATTASTQATNAAASATAAAGSATTASTQATNAAASAAAALTSENNAATAETNAEAAQTAAEAAQAAAEAAAATAGISIVGASKNLIVKNNSGTPNSQVDIDADEIVLKDASGNSYLAQSVNLTANIAASGANGLDTGAEANSAWYYIWVIYNGATVAALLSTSATAPTMPSGYTYKALVGSIYNDGSSNFIKIYQVGRRAYTVENVLSTTGPTLSWSSVSLASAVPPIAKIAYLHAQFTSPAASTTTLQWSPDSAGNITNNARYVSGSQTSCRENYGFSLPLITSQTIYQQRTGDATSTYAIYSSGWEI